jgi:transposase
MNASRQIEAPLLTGTERDAFLARVRPGVSPEDYRTIDAMSEALPRIVAMVEQDHMTMQKLRHLLFGAKTEQFERVCPPAALASPPPTPRRRQGHGRIKARDYTGADWVQISHPKLKAGQPCPLCSKGTLRVQLRSAIILRIEGSPPIAARAYELERLRCDTCGAVFTAPPPAEAGQEKYAPSVAVTIAVLRYGTGMPHHRLARLQQSLGVPLPESTQWELLAPLAEQAQPVFKALIEFAASASVIHHDDTPMRILDLRRPGSPTAALMDPRRKGTFTTNLLAEAQGHTVALYFTGWQHAGENLADVLRQRPKELAPPIQMCDALSRNTSAEFNTILAHCLIHGRREFVTVAPSFPDECRYVLEAFGEIYRFDAEARQLGLNPADRLGHHQTHSQPVMTRLKDWMQEKISGRHVEPNSGLGQAIRYMLKHWEPLTLFLRQAGAPLDNNACERALKMAILHRKNSLSYKTLHGARVGDLFMSLINTCRLGRVNPFAYLLAIATNPADVKARPSAWLPWNYPPSAIPTALHHDPPGLPA